MKTRHLKNVEPRRKWHRQVPLGAYRALCGRIVLYEREARVTDSAPRCKVCRRAYRCRHIPEYFEWKLEGGPKPPFWD